MGENIRAASRVTAILAVLLAGFVGVIQINPVPERLYLILIWIWALIAASLLLKRMKDGSRILPAGMYLLIAATFLNQWLLRIEIGGFSLFIYRLMLIACLLLFLKHLAANEGLGREWTQLQVKGTICFLLAWLAYGTVALIWSDSVSEGIKYLFLVAMGILFVLMSVIVFNRTERLVVFHSIWMTMSAVLIALGLVNVIGHIQLPTSTLYEGPDYKLGFPTATFTNQNDFAAMLSLSFFFYLSWLRAHLSSRWNVTLLMLTILSLALIILAGARASVAAVICGLAFYLYLLVPKFWKKAGLWSAGLMLIGGIAAFSMTLSGKISRFMAVLAYYSPYEAPESTSVRLHLLQSALSSLADTFGFGLGPGNISYALETRPLFNTDHIYEVHNWLAEIAANFGILIAAGYLIMYVVLFVRLCRLYRFCFSKEQRMLAEACMTAQIAFLFSSIGPSSISNLYFHWVFLGFIIACVSVLSNEISRRRLEKPEGA
ncbi:O-antigen ligase family protein [Sporolactobacillus vineae]|uniref:O-antigen ligase family protein n=1 Tax=Sporolactobacillus vineae TaxID=444463 RepID=UPI000288F408|nr:O-antigen ligase family protein [Sporolactobacillus vineae]